MSGLLKEKILSANNAKNAKKTAKKISFLLLFRVFCVIRGLTVFNLLDVS